jgi:putative phosphoribosyl transferase
MIFKNRSDAGLMLARSLANYKFDSQKTIIVGIPRGGIVTAFEVSKFLKIPLETVVIKKLGAPGNSELAIGATASFGLPILDRWLIADLGVSAGYLKKEIIRKRREAKSLERDLGITFDENRFKGKVVVLVDDGLATGQTVKAAGKLLKEMGVAKIILAVPCASEEVIEQVRDNFDDVLSLETRSDFSAVGQFYKDFDQVSTGDVKELLERGK